MRADDGRVVTQFISQALEGAPLTVYGDGSQTRSLCYVSDLVRGFVSMVDSAVFGPVNLGNPHELTVLEIAELVIALVGLWFGAARVRSGSVWMPIGLHLGVFAAATPLALTQSRYAALLTSLHFTGLAERLTPHAGEGSAGEILLLIGEECIAVEVEHRILTDTEQQFFAGQGVGVGQLPDLVAVRRPVDGARLIADAEADGPGVTAFAEVEKLD